METSPQRNSYPQSGDEDSPFSMLKDQPDDDERGFILRTRSLDESSHHMKRQASDEESHTEESSASYALHSSFDATLLQDGSATNLFGFGEEKHDPSRAPSWDETDHCMGDVSGRKHLRQIAVAGTIEGNPPGTIRKQARRVGAHAKTPGRPRLRPPGAGKKPASSTPTSAAKRRRAPLPQRQSPMRRIPPTTPFQAPPIASPSTGKTDHSSFGNGLVRTPFAGTALTPTPQGGPFGHGLKSTSKWHNTGTTAASTVLETTFEVDSVDTSSPTATRFQFTSFPASLPRVNNLRTRECPNSVRKRMSFADPNTSASEMNQSRDDDGTHNTSISSLSAEGGHHQHLPLAPGSLPPSILELDPQQPRAPRGNDDDSTKPLHARLFPDEDNFGYSEDDSTASPSHDTVGRTRLNFNMALSPPGNEDKTKKNVGTFHLSPASALLPLRETNPAVVDGSSLVPLDLNVELSRPYDQGRINSFPSSLSSNTHMNTLSGCDEGGTLTPARSTERARQPTTPREVQLHFPLETECSPIPGIRDDLVHEADHTESSDCMESEVLVTKSTISDCGKAGPKKVPMDKEEGSIGSNSTNGKSRRLRPMPDMSAFESVAASSRGERSTDDSATLDSKGMGSSQRLMCPPTPVRTPAWASEFGTHAFGPRQNSLITTKVLLSAPSQVLEGRCSLESSVLDDDSKSSSRQSLQPASRAEQCAGLHMSHADPSTKSADYPPASVPDSAAKVPRIPFPPKLTRRVPSNLEPVSVISFSTDFEVMGALGSGAFADVYKVKSLRDNKLYAVKRNRRQFRGKRDRDMALAEVQTMQRLQSVCAETGSIVPSSAEKPSYCLYLLFFYRAWQEDGYFFCQTELCCRDTCRELLDSLRFLWSSARLKYPSLSRNSLVQDVNEDFETDEVRLVPNETVWKICHDILAGLSHIHSHKLVHGDLKPSNVFFVPHPRFGAMCKIGDFGMAGEIGTSGDGIEGDARYMPPEVLSSDARHPSSDIFSLGLTLYEIATDQETEMPSEGPHWHDLRSANGPELPACRGKELEQLVQSMTNPSEWKRPTADSILHNQMVACAGLRADTFLRDYIRDIEDFDRREEERLAMDYHEDQTPRNGSHRSSTMPARSPSLSMLLPAAPSLLSPVVRDMQ